MNLLHITYDEIYWDKNPDHWHNVSQSVCGVELCLTKDQLNNPFYISLLETLEQQGKIIRFHLPHHIEDENLAFTLNQKTKGAYKAYYEALTLACSRAGITRAYLVHHPMTCVQSTQKLLKYLAEHFHQKGMRPLLEPTVGTSDTLFAINDLAILWHKQFKYPLLCLDVYYLKRLSDLNQGLIDSLLTHTACIHFHNQMQPHTKASPLSPSLMWWVEQARLYKIPISLELLSRACSNYPEDLQEDLYSLQKLLTDCINR